MSRSDAQSRRLTLRQRFPALITIACTLGVLIIAAWLNPSSEGHGTHTQLGMPQCGWVSLFNKPCLTCGMTTSFAYAADRSLWQSFKAQPMGMLLAVGCAGAFWGGLQQLVFGTRVGSCFGWMTSKHAWIAYAVLGGVAWAYKIWTW